MNREDALGGFLLSITKNYKDDLYYAYCNVCGERLGTNSVDWGNHLLSDVHQKNMWKPRSFENFASYSCNTQIALELTEAKIPVFAVSEVKWFPRKDWTSSVNGMDFPKLSFSFSGNGIENSEVPTNFYGKLGSWKFQREWYYWVAHGNEIPLKDALELHSKRLAIRAGGHCGDPKPDSSVSSYHIDTQEGLNALAGKIRELEGL